MLARPVKTRRQRRHNFGRTFLRGGESVHRSAPGRLLHVDTPESVTGFSTLVPGVPRPGWPATHRGHAHQRGRRRGRGRWQQSKASRDVESGRAGNGWTLLDVMPNCRAGQRRRGRVGGYSAEPSCRRKRWSVVKGPSASTPKRASNRDTWLVIPIVLGVVLLVLFALLRALAASLLVVGAVAPSYLAALGLGDACCSTEYSGFAGAEPTMPVLAFVFLVAFGVDYAIFLVARIAQDRNEFDTYDGNTAGGDHRAGHRVGRVWCWPRPSGYSARCRSSRWSRSASSFLSVCCCRLCSWRRHWWRR